MDKNLIPTEYDECITLVHYLERLSQKQNIKYTFNAHETYTHSVQQKIRNKRMGLTKGFPDYTIAIGCKLIFIEMKRRRVAKVSKEQAGWIYALNNCAGVDAYICYGFEEAKNIIDSYL